MRGSRLEQWIDEAERGAAGAAFLHPAGRLRGRRRAAHGPDRLPPGGARVVELAQDDDVADSIVVYLNRLSDLLFVLARSRTRGSRHGRAAVAARRSAVSDALRYARGGHGRARRRSKPVSSPAGEMRAVHVAARGHRRCCGASRTIEDDHDPRCCTPRAPC
jgi:hypothetical protein